MKGPLPLPTSITSGGSMPSSFLMPSHSSFSYSGSAQPCTVTLPPLYHKSGSIGYFVMDTLPQPLDSLDSLAVTDFERGSPGNRRSLDPNKLYLSYFNLSSAPISDYAAGPFATQVTLVCRPVSDWVSGLCR